MKDIVVYDTNVQPEEAAIDLVYNFIVDYVEKYKHSPEISDIMSHMGWSSTASADRYLYQLARTGHIVKHHKDALIFSLPKKKISNLLNKNQYKVYLFVLEYFKEFKRLPLLKEISHKFKINTNSAYKYKVVFKRKKIYNVEQNEITAIKDLTNGKYLQLYGG